MSELLPRNGDWFEQRALRGRLIQIDQDPEQLQEFIRDTYIQHRDYPHFLYHAAAHLTALRHLDRRKNTSQEQPELELPTPDEAMMAFHSYAQLIHMNRREELSPYYAPDRSLCQRLRGVREELAFHAIFAYARGNGADLVALPTPARQDLDGGVNSSDVQLFMSPFTAPSVEFQVTRHTQVHKPRRYNPTTVVVGLANCLGLERADQVNSVLHQIGQQEELPGAMMNIGQYEHGVILDAAADILATAQHWLQDAQEAASA